MGAGFRLAEELGGRVLQVLDEAGAPRTLDVSEKLLDAARQFGIKVTQRTHGLQEGVSFASGGLHILESNSPSTYLCGAVRHLGEVTRVSRLNEASGLVTVLGENSRGIGSSDIVEFLADGPQVTFTRSLKPVRVWGSWPKSDYRFRAPGRQSVGIEFMQPQPVIVAALEKPTGWKSAKSMAFAKGMARHADGSIELNNREGMGLGIASLLREIGVTSGYEAETGPRLLRFLGERKSKNFQIVSIG